MRKQKSSKDVGITLISRNRSSILINTFSRGFTSDWCFKLPVAFRAALDIRLTKRIVGGKSTSVWTQGDAFAFSIGDTMYDTEKAYTMPWSKALKHIRYSVQVRDARAANGEEEGIDFVKFVVSERKNRKFIEKAKVHCTQTEFVRLLQTGALVDVEGKAYQLSFEHPRSKRAA